MPGDTLRVSYLEVDMLVRLLFTAATVWLASAAVAQDANTMVRAQQLGTILGSEKGCDLKLNQVGIETWIAENVSDTDMSFASMLTAMSQGTAIGFENMTESERTAQCAAVRQAAKKAGLID